MIRVQIEGADAIIIAWKHNSAAGLTNCIISKDFNAKRDNPAVSHGRASCGEKDQFSKEKGRKISLARALKGLFPHNSVPNKKARTAVWIAYLNRKVEVTAENVTDEVLDAVVII